MANKKKFGPDTHSIEQGPNGFYLLPKTYPFSPIPLTGVTSPLAEHLHKQYPESLVSDHARLKGIEIHEQIQAYINNNRWPKNNEAIRAIQLLINEYPRSKGWTYNTEVLISDYNKYASRADIVAYNQSNNTAVILDVKSGRVDKGYENIQLSMYQYMYQKTHPGVKVTGLRSLHTNLKDFGFHNYKALPGKRLDQVFYGAPRSTPISGAYDDPTELVDKKLAQIFGNQKTHNILGKKEFVILDAETGALLDEKNTSGRSEVLSVGAIKVIWDPNKQKFLLKDYYERYYNPKNTHSQSWENALSVHHLTPERIKSFRKLQRDAGLKYKSHYGITESRELAKFIGDSVIVGHNIRDFDLKQLFGESWGPIKTNQILDTFDLVSHLELPSVSQGALFKQLTGMTPDEAGLNSHSSSYDVITNMIVLSEMLKGKLGTEAKNAAYYIIDNNGISTTAYDAMLESMLTTATGADKLDISQYIDRKVFMDDKHTVKGVNGEIIEIGGDTGYGIKKIKPVNDIDVAANAWLTGDSMSAMETLVKSSAKALDAFPAIERIAHDMYGVAEVLKNYSVRSHMVRMSSLDEDSRDLELKSLGYEIGSVPYNTMVQRLNNIKRTQDIRKSDNALRTLYRNDKITEEELNDFIGPSVSVNDKEDFINSVSMRTKREKEWEKEKRQRERQQEREERKEIARIRYNNEQFKKEQANTYNDFSKAYARTKAAGVSSDAINALGITRGEEFKATDALNHLAESAENSNKALQNFGTNIKAYDPNRLFEAQYAQWSGMKSAARGVVPDFLLNPISRLGDIRVNESKIRQSKMNQLLGNIKDTSSMVGGVAGAVLGGPIGGAAGAVVGNIVGGGAKYLWNIHARRRENQIITMGESFQASLNTVGFIKDLMIMPFQLLGGVIKGLARSVTLVTGSFKALNSLLSGLGNPLTSLTGVSYSSYQSLNSVDRLLGLQSGTTNSTIENFAYAQQELYSLGQLDSGRLIASAMLGQFGNVYAMGGNTEEQYSNTVNGIYTQYKNAKGADKQRIMTLARKIDSNLPRTLQVMEDMNISNYNDLKNPANFGVHYRPITSAERTRMRRADYQYDTHIDSFKNSAMRIGTRFWEIGGNSIFNSVNKALDTLAKNMDVWAPKIEKWALKIGTSIKDFANNLIDGDIWEDLKEKINNGKWGDIWSGIIETVSKGAIKLYQVWGNIMEVVADKVLDLLAYLGTIKIDTDKVASNLLNGKPLFEGKALTMGMDSYRTGNTTGNSPWLYLSDGGGKAIAPGENFLYNGKYRTPETLTKEEIDELFASGKLRGIVPDASYLRGDGRNFTDGYLNQKDYNIAYNDMNYAFTSSLSGQAMAKKAGVDNNYESIKEQFISSISKVYSEDIVNIIKGILDNTVKVQIDMNVKDSKGNTKHDSISGDTSGQKQITNTSQLETILSWSAAGV